MFNNIDDSPAKKENMIPPEGGEQLDLTNDASMYSKKGGSGVTVGLTSTLILNRNPRRIYGSICADPDNTTTVWISRDQPAVLKQGIPLMPGGSYEFGPSTNAPHVSAMYGIASASCIVGVTEDSHE